MMYPIKRIIHRSLYKISLILSSQTSACNADRSQPIQQRALLSGLPIFKPTKSLYRSLSFRFASNEGSIKVIKVSKFKWEQFTMKG